MSEPTEFQGEGTYDYKCKDADCFFCQKVNDALIPVVKKKRLNAWYEHETDYLIKYWNILSLADISEALNRSQGTLCRAARKLDLPTKQRIQKFNRHPERFKIITNKNHKVAQRW